MNTKERQNRIIARGEFSNHCHVVTGDNVKITQKDGKTIINVEDGLAYMKHLLETDWMQGKEVWTGEHEDIKLDPGIYEYIEQVEYDPFEKIIQRAID